MLRAHGHPWTGERGWDMVAVEADAQNDLDRFLANAERRFWGFWIVGTCFGSGKPGAALYRPSGAKRAWRDVPTGKGRRADVQWL